jgi:hypothetical protein
MNREFKSSPRKKEVLDTVLAKLRTEKNGYCRVKHKRGWLGFLRDGDTVFTPQELHGVLREVVGSDRMKPKGEELFKLSQHFNFTADESGIPIRAEEALERFIVISNGRNFFNQIPIGGGKESMDIGIKDDDSKFIFVELKPWKSSNSPMYAMVEGLKSVFEYRTILKERIKDIPRFARISLIILAPKEYYQEYQLIDAFGKARAENVKTAEKIFKRFSEEFETAIFLKYFEWQEEAFLEHCKAVYEARGAKGQQIVCLESADSVSALAYEQWKILVSTA